MSKKRKITATGEALPLFKRHSLKWNQCTKCPLCESRTNVTFYRGQLPSSIVLVGENPSESEDITGLPFTGPAGDMLDTLIEEAVNKLSPEKQKRLRYSITYAVACIPIDTTDELSTGKLREPNSMELNQCKDKLNDYLKLAKPKAVLAIGRVAEKACKKISGYIGYVEHPSSIIKKTEQQYQLSYKRAVNKLLESFEKVTEE